MKKVKHLKEALLSALVIGLGQIIKGDSGRGLKMILWFYLVLPALLFILLYLNGFLFLIFFTICLFLYPIAWIYNIYDAAKGEVR